jgi:hypothetical protein
LIRPTISRAFSREQVEPLIGQGAPALIERALQTSGNAILWRTPIVCWPSFLQRSHAIYGLGRSSTRAHRFALEARRELKSMGVPFVGHQRQGSDYPLSQAG